MLAALNSGPLFMVLEGLVAATRGALATRIRNTRKMALALGKRDLLHISLLIVIQIYRYKCNKLTRVVYIKVLEET